MRFKYKMLSIAIAAMSFSNAYAEGTKEDSFLFDKMKDIFSFSAFGTLGFTHSTERNADYVRIVDTPRGAGHSHSITISGETRLGAQLDMHFTDNLSAVVQGVSEYRPNGSFSPALELGHVKFQVTPGWEFRAGRMAIPWFMVSDYLKVGYALPWLRAPNVVYRTAMSHYDGVETRYKLNIEDVALTAQVLYGQAGTDIASNPSGGEKTKLTLNDFVGLTLQGDYGASTLRFGFFSSVMTLKNSGLDSIFNAYRAQGDVALAKTYDANNSRTHYITLGYTYDPGDWFVRGEVAKLFGTKSMIPMYTSGYVSGGYRFDDITPYITVGRFHQDTDTTIGNADPGIAAFGGAQLINALIGNGISNSHTTFALGARWNFWENWAFKAEYDHIMNDKNSSGGLKNLQPDFVPGRNYDLFSASIDFVF